MSKALIFLLVVSVLLLTACGETNQDVINQYQPQYDQLRVKLQEIAPALPETTGEQAAASLNPPPHYVERSKEALNTDIVMYEQLLNPDVELRQNNQLDLLLSNDLITALRWTGDHSPMQPASLKQKAAEVTRQTLEQGLQIKYLGVARVTKYEPVIPVDEKTFGGGLAEIAGFLVDLDSQEVLCAFNISARPEAQVAYQYKEGENQVQALAEAARSNLWGNARAAFITALNEQCGGEFSLAK
ncbi:MAG: hypothetical protein JXM69_13095 [Anaerolineae bacterium]|nr:hypothetical protein [Anaerolineae bacterium]